jgi:hypothetical protein
MAFGWIHEPARKSAGLLVGASDGAGSFTPAAYASAGQGTAGSPASPGIDPGNQEDRVAGQAPRQGRDDLSPVGLEMTPAVHI